MISKEINFPLEVMRVHWKSYSSLQTLDGVGKVNGEMVFVLVATNKKKFYFVGRSNLRSASGYQIECTPHPKKRDVIILGQATGNQVYANRTRECYKIY